MDRIEAWSRELFSFDVRPFLEERVFAPGEFILREGSFPQHLYFLTQGRAKIYTTHKNGKVSLLNFPAAPDLIGDMELLEVRRESLCVQALTRCHFWVVDSRRCLPQLREDPKFLWFLCNHIAQRSARQSTVLTIQQAYPLKNQLAAFLLMASEGDCYRQRHTEAAEYLGVSYRHLLYVLAQFRKEGLIRREGPEYRILDRAGLEALAAG
ncbi:MAG: transcriptional regulator YeiL [Angelakisella sp.]|nr:transcriptional regulator YeiL [Angelakisella sp.]